MKKNKPKFLRKESNKKSRLGKRRKKKIKWRRQKGKHNKIRQKMKGYGKKPCIGYGSIKEKKYLINDLKPVMIYNLKDLDKVKEGEIAIIAHTSKKNKIKIAEKAKQKNIKIKNLDLRKLENLEKK